MKNFFLLLVVFILSNSLFAQLSDKEFENILQNEDIVILDENMKVSYVGEKAYFIDVVIEKEIEYKILTEAGNEYLDPFVLPQPFDEIYKPHAPTIRNALRLFDEIKISEFNARIIKPDGSTEEVASVREVQKHQIVTELNRFGFLYSYSYSFRQLKPGEILKIKYKYSFPFRFNWERLLSTRMFLVTKIPRKKFDLGWSHQYYLEVDTNFINGATPVIETKDNYIHYSWHFENQPGSLDEQGSRSHAELPWFSFTPKPYEFLYEHYNSFEEEFIPFWYYLSFNREAKLRDAVVDNQIGAKDRDNLMFEKIAKKYIIMAPVDSIGIARLRYFQRYIVDTVNYNNDFKLFNRDEEYKRDHPGMELAGDMIKEHNKEFVYGSMIPKLGNFFFTAYPSDTRSGYIGKEYYSPMLDNEMLFAAVLNNNTLAYLVPKSDKRNLYCEELPFYYENAPVMLLYTYDFAGYKRNFEDVLRRVNTPGSTANDNCRKTNCMAKVKIAENRIDFSTRITLAGQFSTLTRFVYNEGSIDSTINPIYLKKVWDFGDSQKISNITLGKTDFYFPYKTKLNANYSVTGLIENNDGVIEVDLSGWIKHVICKDFSIENRFTDFYPDFSGSDNYAIMLEFDQPVSIAEVPESIDIDNDFGAFNFTVKQMGENKILINSYFLVKSLFVKKENIERVARIFKAIENNNNTTLKFAIMSE